LRLFESGRLPWPAARRFHFFWRGSIRSGGCSVGPGQIRTRIKLRHRGARPWLVTLAVPAETEQRSLFDGTRTSFLIAAKGDGRQRPRGRSLAARVSGCPIPHNRAPKMLAPLRAFGGPRSIAHAGFDRRDLGRAKSERMRPSNQHSRLKPLLDGCFHCRIHLAKKHPVTINFHRPKSTLSVVRNI